MPDHDDDRHDPELFGRLTREQWNKLKADRDFHGIFSAIQENWTIHIDRLRPTWCDGWCETISQDPEEPLDLDYIRDQWGGQRFKLRIKDDLHRYVTAVYVKIDAEPKRWGKRIPHPDEVEHDRRRRERELELAAITNTPQAPPAAPTIDPVIGKMLTQALQASTSSKDAQLDFLTDIVKKQINRQPEKSRDLQELLELAKSMREVKDLFDGNQESSSDDVWGANAAKFLDILDKKRSLDDRRPPQQQTQGKQIRIVKNLGSAGNDSATSGLDRSAQGANAPAGSSVAGAPPAGDVQLSRAQLAATLAGMDSIDASAVFMGALAQMDPPKREELIGMLMGEDPGELDDDDEGDDQGDDEGSDEGSAEAAS